MTCFVNINVPHLINNQSPTYKIRETCTQECRKNADLCLKLHSFSSEREHIDGKEIGYRSRTLRCSYGDVYVGCASTEGVIMLTNKEEWKRMSHKGSQTI